MTDSKCDGDDADATKYGVTLPIKICPVEEIGNKTPKTKRKCGCTKTSVKLKQILGTFPAPPPPTPIYQTTCDKATGYTYGHNTTGHPISAGYCKQNQENVKKQGGCKSPRTTSEEYIKQEKEHTCGHSTEEKQCMQKASRPASPVCGGKPHKRGRHGSRKTWLSEFVMLVQLTVTATALALYYIIYCYMQLVYYTLKSAMYFHNADGPMKVTIGVVTVTTLIIAFNIMMRIEALIGIVY